MSTPTSALPKAVRQQVANANKLLEEINKPSDPPAEPPAEPASPTPPAEPAEPPAEPKEPAAPAEPKEPAAPAAPTPPKPEDTAEHRYKVLQGKYNAEVPRLQAANRQLEEQLRSFQQQLNNTQALLAALQTREPAAPAEPKLAVTEEEIRQFGPDLHDFIQRVAKSTVLPEVDGRLKPVQDRFKQVEQSASHVQKTVAQSHRQKVLDALTREVPNWTEQNEDPEFLVWLDQVDPYSGKTRGELLKQAFQAHDASRVVAFFKGFQSENAAVTPDPSPATPAEPEPQQKLDELVAPGTPKTGPASAPNESGKRVWTRKDIADFYAKKNQLVRIGKEIPKEMVALEKDIIKAQGEGRLRP